MPLEPRRRPAQQIGDLAVLKDGMSGFVLMVPDRDAAAGGRVEPQPLRGGGLAGAGEPVDEDEARQNWNFSPAVTIDR